MLLGLCVGDGARLGSEDFHQRQAAEQRLEAGLPLTLPVLLWAERGDDLEAKRRAQRVAGKFRGRCREKSLEALTWWLIYGPNQCRGMKWRRFLNLEWQLRIGGWPKWLREEVYERATKMEIARGYVGDRSCELWPVGYINVLRHRAAGLNDP